MEINLHNYEAFLLDAAEGRLDGPGREQLRAFLLAHPELGADLHDLDFPVTELSNEKFPGIESLYKDIPGADDTFILKYLEGLMSVDEQKRFEKRMRQDNSLLANEALFRKTILVPEAELFVDKSVLSKDLPSPAEERVLEYNEGLMNAGARAAFETELQGNDQLKKLQRELGQCEVTPEMEIVFPDKHTLYRSAKVISIFSLTVVTRMAAALALLVMLTVLLWPGSGDKQPVLAESTPVEMQERTHESLETLVAATPYEENTGNPVASAKVPSEKNSEPVSRRSAAPVKAMLAATDKNVAAEQVPSVPEEVAEAASDSPELVAVQETEKEIVPSQAGPDSANELQSAEVISDLALLEFVEDEPSPERLEKKGLWRKAAVVASHIRNLGVKGVEAEEHTGSVRFGFNTLTVEKKFSGL